MNDPSADKSESASVDWILELYVAAGKPVSLAAQANLVKLCEAHLPPQRYRIDIYDVTDNQELARRNGVYAVPALLRKRPGRPKMIVGDLADEALLLQALNIKRERSSTQTAADGPVAVVDSKHTAEAVAGTTSQSGRGILLVDDDVVLNTLGPDVLGRHGHRVLSARNGADALAFYRGHEKEIGLVITDVTMPGMSGFELASQLRRLTPEIKLLFMSGYARDDDRLREFPGARFLLKPFQINEMVGIVAEMLVADGPSDQAR